MNNRKNFPNQDAPSTYRPRKPWPGSDRQRVNPSNQTVNQFAEPTTSSNFDIEVNFDDNYLLTTFERDYTERVDEYQSNCIRINDEISKQDKKEKEIILPHFHNSSKRYLHGTKGQLVEMKTNFFRVSHRSNDWNLSVYDVKFKVLSESLEHPGMETLLVKDKRDMLATNFESEFKGIFVYDGGAIIYSPVNIANPIHKICKHKDMKFNVEITFTTTSGPDQLHSLQAINILMKTVYYQMKFKPLGRSYFDTAPRTRIRITDLVDGLLAVRSSVSYYEGRNLLFLLDIHYKFEQNETLLEVINKMRTQNVSNETIKSNLLNTTVRTTYNNMTYTVTDVDFTQHPNSQFLHGEEMISYGKYCSDRYGQRIQNRSQPLIEVKNSRKGAEFRIFLIPELCRMTGLPRAMLDNMNAGSIASKLTKARPHLRVAALNNFRTRMANDSSVSTELDKLQVNIGTELVEVTGRELDSPIIYCDGWNKSIQKFSGLLFNPNFRLLSSPNNGTKMIKMVFPSRLNNLAYDLWHSFDEIGRRIGLDFNHRELHQIRDGTSTQYCNEISRLAETSSLIICILGDNTASRYNSIKIQSCILTPVPTQVLLSKSFVKKDNIPSMVARVLPQMVSKMGGEPWGVNLPNFITEKCMFVGIDTYHDAMRREQSAAAFVASLNSNCTRMYSRVSYQLRSLELHMRMRPNIAEACVNFYEANKKTFPAHIIVYRDGVGDGQLAAVEDREIQQTKFGIEDALKHLKLDSIQTTLTFIIVKKRISARFYKKEYREIINPKPGTVIDNTVTRDHWHDFFLISHSPKEGTVNPIHYNVIYDTFNITSDNIQELTYKLAWNYYNYTGSISMPCVCAYAHKLAYLAGISLSGSRAPSTRPEISDKLFYL